MGIDWECLPARMCLSAVSGMGAACFCHPLDVLRVQMQVGGATASSAAAGTATAAKPSVGSTIKTIMARDGIMGFYNGLSAAFLRQWMYGSGRMGIYSFLLNRQKQSGQGDPNFLQKLSYGVISGGIGSFCGTPSEVAIVRMSADNQKPPADRRNYKSVVDCLIRTAKEEGLVSGLYKGATVTVIRAMCLAGSQLATYSETKEYLMRNHKDTFGSATSPQTMLVCSLVGSFISNGVSMPFDVVKSRIQNMKPPGPGESPLYNGMVDCAMKSVAKDGPLVLWRGFTPAFIKLAPYTMISLSLLENLTLSLTGKAAL